MTKNANKCDIEKAINDNLQTRKNVVNIIANYITENADLSDLFMLLSNLSKEAVDLESALSQIGSNDSDFNEIREKILSSEKIGGDEYDHLR